MASRRNLSSPYKLVHTNFAILVWPNRMHISERLSDMQHIQSRNPTSILKRIDQRPSIILNITSLSLGEYGQKLVKHKNILWNTATQWLSQLLHDEFHNLDFGCTARPGTGSSLFRGSRHFNFQHRKIDDCAIRLDLLHPYYKRVARIECGIIKLPQICLQFLHNSCRG